MDSSLAFEFVSEIPTENVRVVIPSTVSSRGELFELYAATLAFPDYFGKNWDAFIDCLSDLSWIDADEVGVLHDGLPSLPMSEVRVYLQCLEDILDRYRFRPDQRPRLRIYFTEACRPIVDCLVAGKRGSDAPS